MAPYCCIVFQDNTESGYGEVFLCWTKKSDIPTWICEMFKLFDYEVHFNVESDIEWNDKKTELHKELLDWAWAGSNNILQNTINYGEYKRHNGVVYYWRLSISSDESTYCFHDMTDADVNRLYDL